VQSCLQEVPVVDVQRVIRTVGVGGPDLGDKSTSYSASTRD